MTKKDKLIERFLKEPKDFTYNELKILLKNIGYKEYQLGKTSGSRVKFYNKVTNKKFKIHKPHPSNIIKPNLLRFIKEQIQNEIL